MLILCERPLIYKLDSAVSYAKKLQVCVVGGFAYILHKCRLAVTAFAARRLDVCHRRGWRAEISNGTVLHTVLKFQVDRACFHEGEMIANVGGESGIKTKKKERIEHSQ